MSLLLLLCVSTSIWATPIVNKQGRTAAEDPWFCQAGADNRSWDCIQSDDIPTRIVPRTTEPPTPNSPLAGTPAQPPTQPPEQATESRPEPQINTPVAAVPEPSANPIKEQAASGSIETEVIKPRDPEPEIPAAETSAEVETPPESVDIAGVTDRPVEPSVQPPEQINEPAAQPQQPVEEPAAQPVQPARQLDSDVPRHVALAYRPDQPVSIMDLPRGYWAVQLFALSDKEALEDFASKENIRGMSAARVSAGERVFYVLLLGIYESKAKAELASSDLAPPFDKVTPWIRSVGSLQAAMRKADRLAGSSDL